VKTLTTVTWVTEADELREALRHINDLILSEYLHEFNGELPA
jgi:hypothetical protein